MTDKTKIEIEALYTLIEKKQSEIDRLENKAEIDSEKFFFLFEAIKSKFNEEEFLTLANKKLNGLDESKRSSRYTILAVKSIIAYVNEGAFD